MRVINICNLKGGVAKTVTAVNTACILADKGYKVLVIDNDQQGNASQFFQVYGYDKPGMAELMSRKVSSIVDCIQGTNNENVQVVASNLKLATADRELNNVVGVPREIILKKALEEVADCYDFVIIDNAPSLSISVINALVACDDVIIPTKADRFTFEGVATFVQNIKDVQQYWNPKINFMGCLLTFYRNSEVNNQGADYIGSNFPMMETKIRYSEKINESTFGSDAITIYSKRSGPAKDYCMLVDEYLRKVGM